MDEGIVKKIKGLSRNGGNPSLGVLELVSGPSNRARNGCLLGVDHEVGAALVVVVNRLKGSMLGKTPSGCIGKGMFLARH